MAEAKLILLGSQITLSKPKSEGSKSHATGTFYHNGKKFVLMMEMSEVVDIEGKTHKVPKYRLGEVV
tara:strand:- start:476 stop:676 length:201 start_codon:yes stop_codon:yes gene_type:complete